MNLNRKYQEIKKKKINGLENGVEDSSFQQKAPVGGNYLISFVSSTRRFKHDYFRRFLKYIQGIETKKVYRQTKENASRALIINN